MMTDSSGTVIRAVTYMPFGTEASSSGTDHYNFAGMEEDSETGFNHTLFRQQSPVMGRWLSPDPYNGSMDPTNPQSLNRYAYVGNNPSNFIDTLGLNAEDPDTVGKCYDLVTDYYVDGQLVSSSRIGWWPALSQ
jgi:RHS repeat-associated protein